MYSESRVSIHGKLIGLVSDNNLCIIGINPCTYVSNVQCVCCVNKVAFIGCDFCCIFTINIL